MKPLRVVNLVLLCALLTGGLTGRSTPAQAMQTAYDCSTATGLSQTECEALVAFYNATGGDSWYYDPQWDVPWLSNTTPCIWYGVTCEAERVTQLSLSDRNLNGALPPEIGNLTALNYLDLSGNPQITLPPEIGDLTALNYLDLSSNPQITLPPEIGNLIRLRYLNLFGNNLATLPPEIGNLTALWSLGLADNALTTFPPEITNFTALEYLYLGGNALTTLPPEIGNLAALKFLYLDGNALTTLPPEIGDLVALTHLYLYDNALTVLPPEIGNLVALQYLFLWDNTLTTLPTEIGNLVALKFLEMWDNALTSLPPGIGNLAALEGLYLSNNNLTNLPPEIGNLTTLRLLYLDNNTLTTLPPEIGNLTKLAELHLGYNALTFLPSEIGNLTALWWLDLGNNALMALPPEIGNLTKLDVLYLNTNTLTALPPEISGLTALAHLDLSSNALTALPLEMGDLTALRSLHLNNNPLSGAMTEMLITLTSLYQFSFYNTAWCVPETGPVPTWLATIEVVHGTGLVCNQAPGSLCGTVTHLDVTPAAGVQVKLYHTVLWSFYEGYQWSYVTTTYTLADGTYQFDSLGQDIDYRVEFIDPTHIYAPQYYDNHFTLEQSTPVTVTLGMTRTGIDAVLLPAVVKSAKPAGIVFNGKTLVYQLLLHTDIDTTLHLYDPLDAHLTWQGFVDSAPDTLTYADGALTGTVALSATTPLTISFAVQVNVPPESIVSEYAQVSNTAYYAFPDETLVLAHPSNTQVNVVHNVVATIYLPLVMRKF